MIVRLRRIEEQLAEIVHNARRPEIRSSFVEKIVSPLTAQAEAARLLETLSSEEAIRQLVIEGNRQAMAEDAVFVAGRRIGISK